MTGEGGLPTPYLQRGARPTRSSKCWRTARRMQAPSRYSRPRATTLGFPSQQQVASRSGLSVSTLSSFNKAPVPVLVNEFNETGPSRRLNRRREACLKIRFLSHPTPDPRDHTQRNAQRPANLQRVEDSTPSGLFGSQDTQPQGDKLLGRLHTPT